MLELLRSTGVLLLYCVVAVSTAFTGRMLIRIPDELFRKILHCLLLGFAPVFVYSYARWWHAVAVCVFFVAAFYPVLALLEKRDGFAELTTERRPGELKASMVLVFIMFIVVFTVCWGWLNDRLLVLAVVFAWGPGDAAAALVGKAWGRHKIRFGPLDGKKSVEGSAAMFLLSLVSVAAILLWRGGLRMAACIVVSLMTAFVSMLAELLAPNGDDTIICPLAAMVVLLPLIDLFGGLT